MVIQMGSRDSRSATLIIRSKAADGTWRRAPIAKAANGRIRPGYAIVDGQSAQTDQFLYQVRYYENRKLKYRNAGKNASDAETLRRRIEAQTTVRADAIKAGLKVEADEDRRTISGSAAAYIRDAEQRGALEAAAQARSVTAEFSKLSRRTYVDEVTRDDIFRFHT